MKLKILETTEPIGFFIFRQSSHMYVGDMVSGCFILLVDRMLIGRINCYIFFQFLLGHPLTSTWICERGGGGSYVLCNNKQFLHTYELRST